LSRIPSVVIFVQKLAASHGLQIYFFLHYFLIKSQKKFLCTAICCVVSGTFSKARANAKYTKQKNLKKNIAKLY